MFTEQMLVMFREQVARLGMALIAIKLNSDLRDRQIVSALNDGYKVCSFLIIGQAFYSGTATRGWAEAEVFEAFNLLADRQRGQPHLATLQRLAKYARAMQNILINLLHLAPCDPRGLETATVYCHELYQVLSQGM